MMQLRDGAEARGKRMGLYGGTFDPVHLGHVAVATTLLKLFSLDEVLFIPAHVAPHKRGITVTRGLHRYAMLALATSGNDRLKISSVELDAPERPYSIDTIAALQKLHGLDSQLFFIMGADSWNEIDTWRDWERLLHISNHVVVTRPGHELKQDHIPASVRERIVKLSGTSFDGRFDRSAGEDETRIFFTDAVQMDISATEVRQAIRSGHLKDTLSVIPPSVADYIRKYGLYTNEQ
jgi:nicotinate-nucleotide adenylyltransferase